MIPEEKAKELFEWAIKYGASKEVAKLFATRTVDEIISQWEYIDIYLSDLGGELNINLKYWYQVKQEIEKL